MPKTAAVYCRQIGHSHNASTIVGLTAAVDARIVNGLPIITKTDSYTATLADCTIICNKGTAMTITLPAAATAYASGIGHRYNIKSIGAGVVTVDGDGSETIDGQTTIALSQWDSVYIQTDGTGWYIL